MPDAGACFDWDSEWPRHLALLEEARQLAVTEEAKQRFRACATDTAAKQQWIEQVQTVSPSLAWVLLAFKNDDGSTAKLSELYTRVSGRWLQRAQPTASELALLPSSWPAPPMTLATSRTFALAEVLKRASVRAGCPFDDPDDANPPPVGGATPSLRPRFAP